VSEADAEVGLCSCCAHARVQSSAKAGKSRFWRCALADLSPGSDARYKRYPPLPVLRCAGFAPGEPGGPERG
jgi:hypothetical protein